VTAFKWFCKHHVEVGLVLSSDRDGVNDSREAPGLSMLSDPPSRQTPS